MSRKTQVSGVFHAPFSGAYWKCAFSELKNVKMLILAALLIALRIALGRLFIPLPVMGGQRIYFTFIIVALGAMIYGPALGVVAGAVGDLIDATLFPTGPFFFGYTLTAMAGPLLYGLFFYKSRLSVARITFCKLLVNVLVNIFMNTLWSAMMTHNDFWLLVIARTPKNLLMLPLEVLLMVVFFSAVVPILRRERIIGYAPYERRIPWF